MEPIDPLGGKTNKLRATVGDGDVHEPAIAAGQMLDLGTIVHRDSAEPTSRPTKGP